MTDQTTIRTTRAGCPVRRGDAWLLTALIALLPAALAQGMGDMGQTEAPPDGPMGMEAADGVRAMGPFGFQLDVFEHMPGTEGYSPLRRLNLVTWNDPAQARILRSADEVQAALDDGEIRVEQPGVVVNAPVLMWPLGRR